MVRDVTKVTLWGSHGTVPLRPLNRITKWVFMFCSALGRQLTLYELGVVLIRVFTRAGPPYFIATNGDGNRNRV